MATIQFTISNIDLEEFSAKRTILKMSLGIVLVFDLGKPETFQHLKERMPEITQNAGFIPILLIGTNKEAEAEGVMIPSLDIDQFMFKHGIIHYFRISTSTGEGIQNAFNIISDDIIKEIIRKLGPEEIKRKNSFSISLAMIGDKCIRKDLISDYGVQRSAAPSMGGAISHKMMDRDINHLLREQKMDTPSAPPAQQVPMGGGGPSAPGGIREAQLDELKHLKEFKDELIDKIAEKEMKQEVPSEEVSLQKPEPLQPMDFKESEEKPEISPDLKSDIKAEVNHLRGIMSGESPQEESRKESEKGIIPPPPGAPPSMPPAGPPASLSAPKPALKKKAPLTPPVPHAPTPEPSPMRALDEVSIDDLSPPKKMAKKKAKSKERRKIGKVKRSSMDMAMDMDSSYMERQPTPVSTTPSSPPKSASERVMDEFEYEEELMEEDEGEVGYGALAGGKVMEITTEKLVRKTTAFYRERMNPETLNKLAVVLSTEKIYEKLKIKIEEIARAATDKALEIDKDVPTVEVVPEFPGCVCVPSVQKINAEKDYDIATFLITPLQTGDIPDACVKLYNKGQLIETIPTPTKVVKTTAAKITAGAAVIVPILSQFPLLSTPIGNFFSGILSESLYASLGSLDGIVLILTGVIALISGLFYLFKRPKDAKPVETFPELDDKLLGKR
ncbi:MAG: hypothetical protein ACTSRD_11265 [Promethearchaeota archaeon]